MFAGFLLINEFYNFDFILKVNVIKLSNKLQNRYFYKKIQFIIYNYKP
jgi:hypothetical protein